MKVKTPSPSSEGTQKCPDECQETQPSPPSVKLSSAVSLQTGVGCHALWGCSGQDEMDPTTSPSAHSPLLSHKALFCKTGRRTTRTFLGTRGLSTVKFQ